MDTAQWPEGNINGVVKIPPMETNPSGAAHVNKPNNTTAPTRAQKPQASNCPRCNSGHTKFCYYNNYSLSQPRYFCKTCRRYWTEGGSLRNVPVGGGSRKNKRSSSSSSFLSKNIKLLPHDQTNPQNPNKILIHEAQDLNLAYPPTGPIYNSGSSFSEFVEFPSTNTTTSSHHISELLKSGINGGRGFSSFMSMIPVVSDSNNNPGLHNFQDFSKPSGVNFSLDHHHGGFESLEGVHQENGSSNSHAKLFFPFEDLKQQPALNSSSATNNTHELMENSGITQGSHHQSTGYWNGSELGGGGSW